MDDIKITDLPDNHAAFIKAIEKAADENGVHSFLLEYRPRFDVENIGNCAGNIKVAYRSTDGRGRPEKNMMLSMHVDYSLKL